MRNMEFTPDSAKQFLLSKLSAQADHERVTLDEVEKDMFLFSESSGNEGLATQEVFDSKYDSTDYESKITKLLREAYAYDKRAKDRKQEWTDALKAVSREDFYGLVMIGQAGIPRSQDAPWRSVLGALPLGIAELVVIGVGFLVIFGPVVPGLSLPDWVRWLAYPLFVWLVWYIGRVFARLQLAKAVRRSGLRSR
jgi:hypothetical protein